MSRSRTLFMLLYRLKFIGLLLWLPLVQAQLQSQPQPQQIVSLDLCTDWLLQSYAAPALQIHYSPLLRQYPNPRLRDGLTQHDGRLETILALQPDLVLSGPFNATQLRKRLTQLGVSVAVLPFPQRLDDIDKLVARLRELLPVQEALLQTEPQAVYPPRHLNLLMLGANGIGTGLETLENDVLEAAGWQNYLNASGFQRLDMEQLVSDPPDAVLWTQPVSASLANLFTRHAALAEIRGAHSTLADSWRWQCPGPWTFQLIDELAQWKRH